MKKILVTGGAGFIGSWTVDLLLEKGYDVRIIDSLEPRVHPHGKPEWVPAEAEFIQGDAADHSTMSYALEGIEGVFHLAAYQDYMPDFSRFIHSNTESAALLFELIVSNPQKYPVQKMVFASSQSVCGEGLYVCREHGTLTPPPRSLEQLKRGDWDLHCPLCQLYLAPTPIPETVVSPGTTYAISKYAIELLADRLGRRYSIPVVCMRYTYVQGPRNSFFNAYSGIARRFALRLLHGLAPTVYEDGGQLRDYVNVRDVARANVLVLEDPRADFQVFNVGGGRGVTVLDFAQMMLRQFASSLEPSAPGEFRLGDTRHTMSDLARMKALGWAPTIAVEQNVAEYVGWIREQKGTRQYLEEAEKLMHESGVIQCRT